VVANANDADGTIQLVEFFANDVQLCSVTTQPYQCTFTPAAGQINLYVRATDNQNDSAQAGPITITAQAVMPPPTANNLFLPSLHR
jgi:hypothetical protein